MPLTPAEEAHAMEFKISRWPELLSRLPKLFHNLCLATGPVVQNQ
jgi:hypothetical protein